MADDSETGIKIYLRDIMQTPLLTAPQESELAARVGSPKRTRLLFTARLAKNALP
jgi:hypothetical protein